jgi:hypothetical protein
MGLNPPEADKYLDSRSLDCAPHFALNDRALQGKRDKFCGNDSKLWHKSVFIMANLFTFFWADHYCNNIEAERSIFNVVCCEKITGGAQQFRFLGVRDRCFRRHKVFLSLVGSGSDLDKNDGSIGGDHNKVDFAGLAGKVTGKFFKALFLQELFAAFLSPSSEALWVGR